MREKLLNLLFNILPVVKFRVEGKSMFPSFSSGETVLVDKISYKFGDPKLNDVVVVRIKGGKKYMIKRVIRAKNKKYFVIGDNKKGSTDSRHFGWVKKEEILGKVI